MARGWSLEKAVKMEEELFGVNDYQGLPGEKSYVTLTGKVPVLVSAPHSVKHTRRSNTVPKEEDEYTGTLVRLLHELTSCHAIYAASSDLDANFYDDCPYKAGLGELVIKSNIKLVLDLHGASLWRDFAIDIGTCKGKSFLDKPHFLSLLQDALADEGIGDVHIEDTFSACGQATVTRFVSQELGVPALQLEINKRYRDPENHPEEFKSLVEALRKYILELAARL
ncbi:MAG: hypothetical protein ACOYU7_11100 [Bacillota bacterium]|uniref:hypothetical protein n=1 Tax=unclassified Candidatus Desulforudis TaxID=2635950 RepID=UPI0034877BC0